MLNLNKDVLNVKEVAEYLGLGIAKVYGLIERRQIPASKIGKQYRFLKPTVNYWLNANIVMEDTEFLQLLRDVRKDFKNAGYTQKDIDRAVAQVKKSA